MLFSKLASLLGTCRQESVHTRGARSLFRIYEFQSHEVHSSTLQKVHARVFVLCPCDAAHQGTCRWREAWSVCLAKHCFTTGSVLTEEWRLTDLQLCHLQPLRNNSSNLWIVFTFHSQTCQSSSLWFQARLSIFQSRNSYHILRILCKYVFRDLLLSDGFEIALYRIKAHIWMGLISSMEFLNSHLNNILFYKGK